MFIIYFFNSQQRATYNRNFVYVRELQRLLSCVAASRAYTSAFLQLNTSPTRNYSYKSSFSFFVRHLNFNIKNLFRDVAKAWRFPLSSRSLATFPIALNDYVIPCSSSRLFSSSSFLSSDIFFYSNVLVAYQTFEICEWMLKAHMCMTNRGGNCFAKNIIYNEIIF